VNLGQKIAQARQRDKIEPVRHVLAQTSRLVAKRVSVKSVANVLFFNRLVGVKRFQTGDCGEFLLFIPFAIPFRRLSMLS
jgi:hypothetical protein